MTAVTVPDNRFTLEGNDLVIVEVGYTDTDASSVLHVPDLGLVVAGDVIYNGAHLYLSETSLAGLRRLAAGRSTASMLLVLARSWPVIRTPTSTTTLRA